MTLGQMIRERRKFRGLSLRALAAQVGVSAAYLSDLERGNRSTTRFRELARALGVSEAKLRNAVPRCKCCGQILREAPAPSPGGEAGSGPAGLMREALRRVDPQIAVFVARGRPKYEDSTGSANGDAYIEMRQRDYDGAAQYIGKVFKAMQADALEASEAKPAEAKAEAEPDPYCATVCPKCNPPALPPPAPRPAAEKGGNHG